MCWACDHPERTRQDYLDHVRTLIERYGWAVQGVERDRLRPPWAYTVGLTPHGKPELLVTGVPLGHASRLLNDVAAHVLHAAEPVPGDTLALTNGSFIEIVEVAQPAVHLRMAVDLYGTQVRALQVVHADDRGHWPWDRRYQGGPGGQPVLGVRARGPHVTVDDRAAGAVRAWG